MFENIHDELLETTIIEYQRKEKKKLRVGKVTDKF